MRNIENTAVNELVARASGGPRFTAAAQEPVDPSVDPEGAVTLRVAAPFSPSTSPSPVGPRRLYQLAMGSRDHERLVPTVQMRRRSEIRTVVVKLVFPIALLMSIGVVIGAYVAFGGDAMPRVAPAASFDSHAVTATPSTGTAPEVPAAPAELAVAPAPVASAPAGEVKTPALVDIRIDSIPSGATVTLVDRGRSQLVGNTPVDAAIDPSRDYDVVFTLPDQPSHVEHLDPRTTRRLAVALGKRNATRKLAVDPMR